MNKTTMWGIGAVIALVLAIGFWMSMKNSAPDMTATPQAGAQNEKSSGSIASLVSRGATVQCAVNSSSGPEATKGTVYVSGKKVRGDFESSIPQKGATESHMITDGEYIYVWSSAMPQGMKMKATPPSSTDAKPRKSPEADMYAKNYDYNCAPWSADGSKFELPAGVEFMDMSSMMKGIPMPPVTGVDPTVKLPAGVSCSTCDAAPAAARAQCRAALGCK